jgi:hypothetical protein
MEEAGALLPPASAVPGTGASGLAGWPARGWGAGARREAARGQGPGIGVQLTAAQDTINDVILIIPVVAVIVLIVCLVRIRKNPVLAAIGISLVGGLGLWIVVHLIKVKRTYEYAGTRAAMLDIAKAFQGYHKLRGSFPAGMKLVDLDPTLPQRDVWGHDYDLQIRSDSFIITSWGRDGTKGGSGYEQDLVVSWKAGDKESEVDSADISP